MAKGITLLETMIAMILVGISMTTLLLVFLGSGQYGVIGRRQANAVMVARSIANQLNHAAWTDARLANNNLGNDADFADPNGLFAGATVPSGGSAADNALGTIAVGDENFDAYVNVLPQMDPLNNTIEMGRLFAVIVRYRVGTTFNRAVVLGYRYNPATVGVGQLPL